jgi:hypothetical protein
MRVFQILIIFIVVASIYVLPLITARFAGSHTAEFNATSGPAAMECTGCHSNILSELQATTESQRVFQIHADAAGNTSYVRDFLTSNITNSTDSNVCMLCHLAQTRITDSHTQLVVRACTDLDCHGNNATTNNTGYPTTGNVGIKLGETNAHERWFDALSGTDSLNRNETGDYYSHSFWTCLGCHTGVGVDIDSTEALYPHDNAEDPQRRYF